VLCLLSKNKVFALLLLLLMMVMMMMRC